MYIPDNKEQYDYFFSKKTEIENDIGYALKWNRLDGSKASLISTDIPGLNFKDHSNYDELINATIDKIIEFKNTFKKFI